MGIDPVAFCGAHANRVPSDSSQARETSCHGNPGSCRHVLPFVSIASLRHPQTQGRFPGAGRSAFNSVYRRPGLSGAPVINLSLIAMHRNCHRPGVEPFPLQAHSAGPVRANVDLDQRRNMDGFARGRPSTLWPRLFALVLFCRNRFSLLETLSQTIAGSNLHVTFFLRLGHGFSHFRVSLLLACRPSRLQRTLGPSQIFCGIRHDLYSV